MQWTSGVVQHVLPNGLTVLVQQDRSAPVVALLSHVKAGYFDEPDEWVGISHVLEHMFFKGSRTRGPGEIARDVQVLGGYLNASTIYDKTVYYTVVPSTDGVLERAMEIQADALTEAALDAEELARELEVIVQEAKRKLDSPPAVAREGLYELLFTAHRMRRWRIGTEAGLRRLTAADVRRYYDTRYVPARVIVAIVGDLDVDRTLAHAGSVFGSWARQECDIPGSPPEPAGTRPAMHVHHGDVERSLALIGWRTVGTLHPDAAALDLAASLLGHGRGSRLYRALRLPGLASSASAVHYTPTSVGVFDLALESETGTLDQAIERSLTEVVELIERGPSPAELDRARALIAASWARQCESMDGKAAVFTQAEALGGFCLADELYDQIMDVTAADVQRVAARFLDPASASAFLHLPTAGSTALTNGGWPMRPARRGDARPEPVASQRTPRTAAGPARPAVRHPGSCTHVALPGADVLVRPKPGSGLVTIHVHVPGLTDRETADDAGISRLVGRATVRGAGGMDGESLAREAEFLGGSIVPSASADGLGWSMTVRGNCLPQAAELLRCVALEPTLAADEVAVERGLQASDARRLRDDMFRYPVQRVLNVAYPDDPYGLPTVGDPARVETISVEQVRAWSAVVPAKRAAIVAVGDLETEELLDGLAPLTEWPGGEGRAGPNGAPTFAEQSGAEHRDKAQSALVMAFPAQPIGSPDRYAIAVMCGLLSGMAGRLFEALRERRSLAYTVAAMPWLRRRAGVVLTYIATAPEREDEAREAMLRELARLASEPIPTAEIERARNYAAGSVAIGRQRGAAVVADLLDAWLYGFLDEFADPGPAYRAVSAGAVRDLARRVFVEGGRAEFVLRGSGKSR